MTDKKISELTSITGANVDDANDVLPIVDTSATTTKKITREELFKGVDVLELGDGSAASPSLSNTGDTNTGLFFPAADTVAWATGGVEAWRTDSSGRVGIGMSTLSGTFSVSAGTNKNFRVLDLGLDNFSNEGVGITFSRTTSDSAVMAIGVADTDKLGLFSREDMIFATGGSFSYSQTTERMRIDSSGNVGIGTSSPAGSLHVVASGAANESIFLGSNSDGIRMLAATDGTGDAYLYLYDNSNTLKTAFRTDSNPSYINGGGNFGIGTSSPVSLLEVSGGTGVITITDSTSAQSTSIAKTDFNYNAGTLGFVGYDGASSGAMKLWNSYNQGLIFGTNNTERMRIDSSGNVGIGLSILDGAFSVSAGTNKNFRVRDLALDNFSNEGVGVTFSRTTSDSAVMAIGVTDTDKLGLFSREDMIFATGGSSSYSQTTERMRIDSSGNVGIGTSSPDSILDLSSAGNTTLTVQTTSASGNARTFFKNGGIAADGAYIGLSGSEQFLVWQTENNVIRFGTNDTERVRIDNTGNLLVGGTSSATSSAGTLHLFNGTAPTGSVANGVVLYSEDVSASAELKVRDEAGNVTTLSPHNFSLIPDGPSEEMAFSYYSEKRYTEAEKSEGKKDKAVNVDMLKLARLLEALTGEKLIYEEEL